MTTSPDRKLSARPHAASVRDYLLSFSGGAVRPGPKPPTSSGAASALEQAAFDQGDLPRFLNGIDLADLPFASKPRLPMRRRGLSMAKLFAGTAKHRLTGPGLWKRTSLTPKRRENIGYGAAFILVVVVAAAIGLQLPQQSAPADRPAKPVQIAEAPPVPVVVPPPAPNAVAPTDPKADAPAPDLPNFPMLEAAQPSADSTDRLTFAPKLEGQPTQPWVAASPVPALETVAAGSAPGPVNPDRSDVVVIRNLPPQSSLSAGKRLSPTEWQVPQSKLGGLVVTLPSLPITTDIEVFDRDGQPAGTARIEIKSNEQVTAEQSAPTPKVVAKRKKRQPAPPLIVPSSTASFVGAGKIAPAKLTPATKSKLPSPVQKQAATQGSAKVQIQPKLLAPAVAQGAAPAQAPGQSAAQDQAPTPPPLDAEAPPTIAAASGTSKPLFYWLTPEQAAEPIIGLSSGEEFLINLGVVPRP